MTENPVDEGPFSILILGDGNFSFTQSLVMQLIRPTSQKPSSTHDWDDSVSDISSTTLATSVFSHMKASKIPSIAHEYLDIPSFYDINRALHIVATSFDSRQQLLEKYKDTKDIFANIQHAANIVSRLPPKKQLQQKVHSLDMTNKGPSPVDSNVSSITILHEINAWELPKHFPTRKFDLILWNHPHLGTEDFRLHRFLLCHFFDSTRNVLTPSGRVMVSLVQGQETRWDLIAQAQKCGLKLQRVSLFQEIDWPGYTVKRNTYGGSFKNTHTRKHVGTLMKSFSYFFGESPIPDEQVDDSILQAKGNDGINASNVSDIDLISEKMAKVELAKQASSILQEKDEISAIPTIVQAQFFTSVKDLMSREKGQGDTETKETVVQHSSTKESPSCQSEKTSLAQPSRKQLRMKNVPVDLKCIHCLKQLNCIRSYRQHVHMVHVLKQFGDNWKPDRERQFPCKDCKKRFMTEKDLWQHQINKHSVVESTELPTAATTTTTSANVFSTETIITDSTRKGQETDPSIIADQDYDYVPCDVCGQAVLRRDWGMYLHLESLKPAVGLTMQCPRCPSKFIESRALIQHYKFCRLRQDL